MSSARSSDSPHSSVRLAANAGSMLPLSSLVYESQAVIPLSEPDLKLLIDSAEARNRKEGITGLLVYDEGRFLQWLEGPSPALERVWKSISQDRRHTKISILGQSTTPVRFFGGSPMALGKRHGHREERNLFSEGNLPASLIEALHQGAQTAPSVLAGFAQWAADQAKQRTHCASAQAVADRVSLRAVVDTTIIPELLARHVRSPVAPLVIDPRATELAQLLLAAEPKAAFALIDKLRADGRSITQLCAGLFEPSARALGDLWRSDDCNEFDVTQGLGYLQVVLRRLSLETSSADVPAFSLATPLAVLVAPSPNEPHLLGSAIASEMFWREGWDVHCEFPDSDVALSQLVHDNWFDVLDLSFSAAFTREHRLPAMAASIRAAHASSRNPALVVVVGGRVFHEQPRAGADIGADASSTSALDIVSNALRHTLLNQR